MYSPSVTDALMNTATSVGLESCSQWEQQKLSTWSQTSITSCFMLTWAAWGGCVSKNPQFACNGALAAPIIVWTSTVCTVYGCRVNVLSQPIDGFSGTADMTASEMIPFWLVPCKGLSWPTASWPAKSPQPRYHQNKTMTQEHSNKGTCVIVYENRQKSIYDS